MNITEIIELLHSPNRLPDRIKHESENILNDYPWFLPARMLYVLNLRTMHDLNYRTELHTLALLAPNRPLMMAYLEPKLPVNQIKKENIEQTGFDLIESFISAHPTTGATEISYFSGSDYFLSTRPDAINDPPPHTATTPEDNLIDDFLAKKAGQIPFSTSKTEPIEEPVFFEEITDDDTYFTETLAQIYIRQKKYEKALEIIKQISLKYPKKNSYFADQIRFLEKLIINIKRDI